MKAILGILGLLFITTGNAQKFDCAGKTADYQELLKENKIKESFDIWMEVRKNCPKEIEKIYTDGSTILQYKIDITSSEEKEKNVRDLMKLYEQYYKNFPAAIPDFEVQQAMALVNNKIEAKDEAFTLLENGFSKAANNITDVKAIHTYFMMYCDRFTAGDKKITSNAVLEKYTLVSTLLAQLQVANPENKDYTMAQNAIDGKIKEIATCENLSDFYNKNYSANQDNLDWLTSALISLSSECSSKPIFQTLAEKLYAIKATAQSANFVAIANAKQRKFPEAIKFYNESAALQTNPIEKAKTYYILATSFSANDAGKSKEYLNKALAADPKMGKAYLFLAQMYVNGSKNCAKTDFEKKAIYNLAIQTLQNVAVAEPKLKPAADKMMEDYTLKGLSASDISKEKMNGKSLTIGCWINETISFPAK
ncbi:tetratricopeptide repeat protein [Flavobacterium sp. 25HG05S-40]|uniref:tetratricopeptide repeat protein n=1 Tax=Flavobacterium sp. 25HG05S-40 TaxID=3458682 RepID=UPI0040439C49